MFANYKSCEEVLIYQEREVMTECVEMQVGEFRTATDDRKVVLILDRACCNVRVGRA